MIVWLNCGSLIVVAACLLRFAVFRVVAVVVCLPAGCLVVYVCFGYFGCFVVVGGFILLGWVLMRLCCLRLF